MAILAGGESLLRSDLGVLRGKARVVAVNDAWRLAPWADVLYGADWPWWNYHRGVPEFAGEKWTQDKPSSGHAVNLELAREWGLRIVRSEGFQGLSFDPSLIHQGGNSGFQALNLSVLFGARRILLLGFDMGGRHWNRSRPKEFRKERPGKFARWIPHFNRAAEQLADVEVVNCSESSALTCFRKGSLADFYP